MKVGLEVVRSQPELGSLLGLDKSHWSGRHRAEGWGRCRHTTTRNGQRVNRASKAWKQQVGTPEREEERCLTPGVSPRQLTHSKILLRDGEQTPVGRRRQ